MNEDIHRWIDAALDGSISPEDFVQLQEVLKSDPEAFEHFYGQSEIHGRLEWGLGQARQSDPLKPKSGAVHIPIRHARQNPYLAWTLGAAAIVLLLALVTGLLYLSNNPGSVTEEQATAPSPPANDQVALPPGSSVARLTIAQETRWHGDQIREGAWLAPGMLKLLSGSAEITFDSGARIILRGPADLKLIDSHSAKLVGGQCVTHIPNQAAGFELITPSSVFDDPDSSFSVAVDSNGHTEVRNLYGILEAGPRSNKRLARTLGKNEAARITKSEILHQEDLRLLSGDVEKELPPSTLSVPSDYVHWSFDRTTATPISGSGSFPGGPFPAKVELIHGAPSHARVELTDGKFGKAAYLDGQGAVLSTAFPGIPGSQARTVAFWVRIPPGAGDRNAYSIVSWGNPQKAGGKWQIAWNKESDQSARRASKGAIRTEFNKGFVIGSTDLRDGKWHHVVSVFLGGRSEDVAAKVRHYVDGRLEPVSGFANQIIDTRLAEPGSIPTYVGRRMEGGSPISSFKGTIDELYIFPSALTPGQIEELYRTNTPPEQFVAPERDP